MGGIGLGLDGIRGRCKHRTPYDANKLQGKMDWIGCSNPKKMDWILKSRSTKGAFCLDRL